MSIVPMTANTVRVGMVRKGCCYTEFSSNYPAQLNGIISPNDFHESITTINKRIYWRKCQLSILLTFILCMVCGIVLMPVGTTAARNTSVSFIVFIGIGGGLIFSGMIFFIVGTSVGGCIRANRMRKAVSEESQKYSTGSRIPTTWTLHSTAYSSGYGRNRRTVIIYHIIIHLPPTVATVGNANLYQNPSGPRSTFGAPPPYPGGPAAFCSGCGVPRADLKSNFCTACGQPFNR